MTWSAMEAREAQAEDRHGEWIMVACRQCELGEEVLFDARTRRPWRGVEPCPYCDAPAAERYATEHMWEYAE